MNKLENAYALLIGVGNDLPVTVRDATAIHNILADETLAGYKPENIILLTEKKATRNGILGAFDELISKIDESSSVFLFYSGHGGLYEPWNQFYLVPNNYDPVEYEDTWVKAEELKEKIKAINSKKLILFLDCCHAAGMTKSAPTIGKAPTQNNLENADGLAQNIDDGKGISILSSCREDQLSYIMDGDNNSLFTKCLIEVLKGKHKTHFEEPFVRISEVIQYVFKTVPKRNPDQKPYANLQIYDDFVLSFIPENLRDNIEQGVTTTAVEENKATPVITVFRKTENAPNVIIFVHGFSGEAASSFGNIPKFLEQNNNMNDWDLFPLGFSEYVNPAMGKNIWASVDDIDKIADYLSTSLKYKFGKYKRIAVVAHGLGGLVAQKALINLPDKHLKRIGQVFLFATPSNGIASSVFAKLWNKHLKELSEDGQFIKTLRQNWQNKFSDNKLFILKVIAATHDEFVTTNACFKPFKSDECISIIGNHFSLIKPKDTNNDSYNLILELLAKNNAQKSSNKTTASNTITDNYTNVVNELLPKVAHLDKRGLEKLTYALEALDRGEEAILILQKHKLTKNNSDLLGIIGGRYKRRYLVSYIQKDGIEALNYYKKALDIAQANKDSQQIYYLAINLAFLNLIVNESQKDMKTYANTAIKACDKDSFSSLWKLATLAEANLYLGNLDKSKKFYLEASKLAGRREKISIYSNAFTAYSCLMQSDNLNDDFSKFLKTNFLN